MMTTFGHWLREFRLRRGMTQTQLAERLGISLRTFHYWETDVHIPYRKGLARLLEYLSADAHETEAVKNILMFPAARQVAPQTGLAHHGSDLALLPMGALIRALRSRRGWTQAKMASHFGLGSVTVLRWEQGRHNPPGETLHRICMELCVSEAERNALWNACVSRYAKEFVAGKAISLDACRTHIERMERERQIGADPLFEIYSLVLYRALNRLQATMGEAVELRARLDALKELWLPSHERAAETKPFIESGMSRIDRFDRKPRDRKRIDEKQSDRKQLDAKQFEPPCGELTLPCLQTDPPQYVWQVAAPIRATLRTSDAGEGDLNGSRPF